MPRNDPTETGGLFIGRRPGTAPVRLRTVPERTGGARQRLDGLVAHALLGLEILLCLSLFGPQTVGWLWVASQVDYLTDYVTAAFATAMVGSMASLFLTMALAKRVDHAWKLARRAAGHRQERGALERVFVSSVVVAAILFGFWFFVINGPGPTLSPAQ
jgi:hypothetical protein